jgi:chromosome segregation ATPase
MPDYLRKRISESPARAAVIDTGAIRLAIDAAQVRRAEILTEIERATEFLREMGADVFLQTGDDLTRDDIATTHQDLRDLRDELQLIEGTLGELDRKLRDAEHAERRDRYQTGCQQLWRAHQGALERRARLASWLASGLDDIEEEARQQAAMEAERMRLGRESRGLDVDLALPPSLEPWLARAMDAMHQRWQMGLARGGE